MLFPTNGYFLEYGLQVKYRPYEKELMRYRKLGEQLAAVTKSIIILSKLSF